MKESNFLNLAILILFMYLLFMAGINHTLFELEKKGYSILKNVIKKNECDFLKKKLNSLYRKLKENPYFVDEDSHKGQIIIRDLPLREPKIFLKYLSLNRILKIINRIYNDKFILDNMMASNSYNVKENFDRKVHIDSQLPVNSLKLTTDVVVMICLDDFEISNGATKVWPGSHKSGRKIHHEKQKINDKNFKHLLAPKGSASVILGQTWHQVGKNNSNKSRWSIFLHYKRWWMKSSTNFINCGPKIFKMLNNNQKELFGFTSIPPSYDFKKKTKKIYTLRKVASLDKNYAKNFNY